MRLLFVSGTTIGGSGRSQRELAARLVSAGHRVLFLVDPEQGSKLTRFSYEQLSDLSARIREWPGSGVVRWCEGRPGRRVVSTTIDRLPHLLSPVPENALAPTLDEFEPDVVVGSSILRLAWRRIREQCSSRDIPTVLYVREQESMNHFELGDQPGDVIVANARSLVERIAERGYSAHFVPSVIETAVTATDSTRSTALLINPIESRGSELFWDLAGCCPDVHFVAQESWPLSDEERAAVEAACRQHENVEFRQAEEPGPQLYRDSRVLLVPYRVDNRPRVIAEAQANGIPVLAGDVPALSEAIGDGGLCVPLDDVDAWAEALHLMWHDPTRYEGLSAGAVENSRRPEIDPALVAGGFEQILVDLITQRNMVR